MGAGHRTSGHDLEMHQMRHGTLNVQSSRSRGQVSCRRRYEREVNRAQHSVLKRIMEHNDPPGRMMVLAVAALRQLPPHTAPAGGQLATPQLVLSDGWCASHHSRDKCDACTMLTCVSCIPAACRAAVLPLAGTGYRQM